MAGGVPWPPPEKNLSDNFDACRKFLSLYLCTLKNVLVISVKLEVTVCNIKVSGVVAGGRPIAKFRHFLPFFGKTIN